MCRTGETTLAISIFIGAVTLAALSISAQVFGQVLPLSTGGQPPVDAALGMPLKTYSDALAIAEVTNLRDLQEALNNPHYIRQWRQLAVILAYAGESNASSEALISFIDDNQGWKLISRPERFNFFGDKCDAMGWLGFTAGPSAEKRLLELIEPAGAEGLLRRWSEGSDLEPWNSDRGGILASIQGSAAKGLAILRNPVYDDLVKRRVHEVLVEWERLAVLLEADPENESIRNDESYASLLSDSFYTAQVTKEYLDGHGVEALKKLHWEPYGMINLVWSEAWKAVETVR